MEMRFLIQVLKKGAELNQIKYRVMNSAGDATDWENYSHSYDSFEDAVRESKLLIAHGTYKADEVRVVEVVGSFESEINVSVKGEKYTVSEG